MGNLQVDLSPLNRGSKEVDSYLLCPQIVLKISIKIIALPINT